MEKNKSGAFAKLSNEDNQRQKESPESKYRQVAKFLILIGSDRGAEILSRLDPPQVEAISAEIASIKSIGPEESESILDEFRSLLSNPYTAGGALSGGPEAARRLLYAAYGPEKGEEIFRKAAPPENDSPFGFLEDFSGEQIAFLLRDEVPQAASLVLSRLSPEKSAAALAQLSGQRKLDIVMRIARQGEVLPEVLEKVAEALREKARNIGHDDSASVDGMGALAAILKQSDISFGDKLLDELSGADPDLSRELRERLYTLEDVLKMENKPLRFKLSSMGDKDIALLLKGRSEGFTEKVLSNVSSSRRALILEEMEIMGAVRRQDADQAARNFLEWFRRGREEGQIIMLDDEDVIK
ncbi:MAG: flagellar motor switch protein FliG [Treponema sp.]|jgi:flagellar motor switch protein FliG|nr:flagellar motor switch protein FliG [Treponema sp.]